MTRDEIRVVAVCTYFCGDGTNYQASLQPLVEHFNRRYEFYGRRLQLKVVSRDSSNGNNPTAQRFVAEKADTEFRPFSLLSGPGSSTLRSLFAESSRRGMVGVSTGADDLTSADMTRWAPYMWSYGPPADVLERRTASFICASLVGKRAAHAGTRDALSQRKFAVLVPKRDAGPPPSEPLVTALERCGVTARVDEYDTSYLQGQPPPSVTTMVAAWRSEGVTSVISLATTIEENGPMAAASRSGYQPEWIHVGFDAQEGVTAYQTLSPQDQVAHVFGVASRNKVLPLADQPWVAAMRESVPGYSPPDVNAVQNLGPAYRRLLLLASGIQAAGPKLTPETFAAALARLRFPNPGAGRAPAWQAEVGFGGGRRWMVDDVALKWWEPTAEAHMEATSPSGSWCYVDRGARWSERFPDRDAAFFDRTQPCR